MMKLKGIYKNIILIIVVCMSVIFSMKSYSDIAIVDSSVIRVGLEALYYNAGSMNIRNTSVVMGYCNNNTFVSEIGFSGAGLTFTPYKDSFSMSGSYNTYEAALKAAKDKGDNCVPVVTYTNKWAVATLGAGSTDKYAVRVKGDNTDFIYTVDERGQYPQFISDKEVYIDLGERQYRGRIEIGTYGGSGLRTVSIVEFEEYLYSVVSCEMSYSWHMEALKTQAVCARSFAVCSTGYGGATNLESPYTLNDTSVCQSYGGYGSERERTTEAVNATKGEVIYYKGEPVKGFYSSTSGGSTENVEDVWGSPKGYLRQVSDIYELEPALGPWIMPFTNSEIESLLYDNNIDIGNITDIRPNVFTASGRVYAMELVGDKGRYTLTGEQLRLYFSLYSTKYKIVKYGDNPDYVATMTNSSVSNVNISKSYIINGNNERAKASGSLEQYVVLSADNLTNYPRVTPDNKETYYLAGMGYGHGIGMSQSGAQGMAMNGFTYDEILKHYFTGVEIE